MAANHSLTMQESIENKIQEAIETIRFYIREGIPQDKAVDMWKSETFFAKPMRDRIIKEALAE